MAPPVEGNLDFVVYRCRIERAIPLGDIEYVDDKNRAGNGAGRFESALADKGRTDDTHESV
jgi:hypothetical protein